MNYKIDKIEENIFQISSDNETFFVVINSTTPVINEKGEIVSQVTFLKSSDEKFSFCFSVPFSLLLNQFKCYGIPPYKYLIDQLIIELKNKFNLDLSKPLNEISNRRNVGFEMCDDAS